MKRAILRAQGKKQKYLARQAKLRNDEDSDGSISSDDEEEISDTFVGNHINNQYLILKYLGKGTFSKVWMVHDFINNKFMALKVQEPKYLKDFDYEVNNLKYINSNGGHKNIMEFYGVLDFKIGEEKRKGILIELLGDSIDFLLSKDYDDKIDSNIIKNIFKNILEGINFIHNKGLLHNDLKPDNILLSRPNKSISNYIEKIEELNINKYYLDKIEELSPNELKLLDKNKRKIVKRKIKEKASKETVKEFKKKIVEINNTSFENIKLDILEINEDDKNNNLDNVKNEDLDLENLSFKIIDFGSAEAEGKMDHDEILARSYRPPENILNSYYDRKADIWVIGCMLYEFFNGCSLFNLKDCDLQGVDKDRRHIAEMYDVLGKMPKEMAMVCEFSEDIFDNKGRVIKNKGIEERDIKKELCYRFNIEDIELDKIHKLIFKILNYNPKLRPSCSDILKNEWFEG